MAFSQLCVQCVSFVDETLGRCCFIFIEIALMEAGEEEWVGQTGRDLDPDSSSDNINSFNIYLYVKKQYSHWADTPLPASMERCVGKALFGSYSVEKNKIYLHSQHILQFSHSIKTCVHLRQCTPHDQSCKVCWLNVSFSPMWSDVHPAKHTFIMVILFFLKYI